MPRDEQQKWVAKLCGKLSVWAENLSRNPKHFKKVTANLQTVTGTALLLLGYFMGHNYFSLIQKGVRAQGTIVDFKYESWMVTSNRGTSWTAAYMPIVEFRVGEKTYRFKNWWGSSSAAGKNTVVPIFYDVENPSVAMIDRGIRNWIPWAPTFCAGLFLMFVAWRGRRENE